MKVEVAPQGQGETSRRGELALIAKEGDNFIKRTAGKLLNFASLPKLPHQFFRLLVRQFQFLCQLLDRKRAELQSFQNRGVIDLFASLAE